MKARYFFLGILLIALAAGGIYGWFQYQQARAAYDAYRQRIQQGVTVAGVEVGWLTPEEARAKLQQWVAEPYLRDFSLAYQDETLSLSPTEDLGFTIPLDDMVQEAMAASHQYDYWDGFKLWVQGQAATLELDIPLKMSFDESATSEVLTQIAKEYDVSPTEPMVNIQELAFIPGIPGRRMDVQKSAQAINERVTNPAQRHVELTVSMIEPDQSRARVQSMLSTLGPVMAREPSPPFFYTATVPLSTTGGLEGSPRIAYSGPLTWTFPHFISYTGHLTQTTGYFVDQGQPGYTFNITRATSQVMLALGAGMTTTTTFQPDLVPAPPITPGLVIPHLESRLAQFPGVTSILVKNLRTGDTLYESNSDYVLSGMSIVKIGIMVEVYRYYSGDISPETHQELLDMLGSESCNPCANRLLASVGGGSSYDGAARVTDTMRRLGLRNFYLCAPFRLEASYDQEQSGYVQQKDLVFTANTSTWFLQSDKPRYDRCVRATPHEMADLVEMIYDGTEAAGLLAEAYPSTFTPQVCNDMINIMAANDLRNMLGAGIPADVKLAHKHGFSGYDVPWGDTRGEVGIVFSPETTWLISFYIWQDTPWINWGINQPLYRDVSNMLYNYFDPNHPYWPPPPWAPAPEEDVATDEKA